MVKGQLGVPINHLSWEIEKDFKLKLNFKPLSELYNKH